MVKSIFISLLLIISSAGNILAQDKPAFIAEIERVFQEKEPAWKVERKYVQNEAGFYKLDIVFRSGNVQAAVSIGLWQREKDARDSFKGEAIAFDNIRGPDAIKESLLNLGDENYIWTNRDSDTWTTIHFRQGKVYVKVFAPSIAVAKRFARYVIEQIPPSKN